MFDMFDRKTMQFLDCGVGKWTLSLVATIFIFIELDDGKILTGKPDQFDGKNPWVSG